MVAIPQRFDPTLVAIDRETERRAAEQPRRSYLGASQIGEPCERKLWYSIRPDMPREEFDADTLRRFEDGHRIEDVMAARLRMVPGVQLWTVDEQTGGQIKAVNDFDGRFQGHCDGVILGLLQAPETPHVWEHTAVNDKKFAELDKLKDRVGEKAALAEWDPVYYAQAVIYMHYLDLTRHYLTVTTPGGREQTSCRTDANPRMAEALREKAKRVIHATEPPARISERKEFYKCKFCPYRAICHA